MKNMTINTYLIIYSWIIISGKKLIINMPNEENKMSSGIIIKILIIDHFTTIDKVSTIQSVLNLVIFLVVFPSFMVYV